VRRTVRALRVALVLLAVGTSVPATAAGTLSCATPGAVTKDADGWVRIAAPDFSTTSDVLTSYAVDQLRPERLFATNGASVSYSRDGGCSWTESILPTDAISPILGLGGEAVRVDKRQLLDIQPSAYVPSATVWALGQTDVVTGGTPLVQPRILVSTDGGATFADRASGLPQFARPIALHPDLVPTAAYVLLDEQVPQQTVSLWFSPDGGANWTKQSSGLPSFQNFAVDPYRHVLWAWDGGATYFSLDRGATFKQFSNVPAVARLDPSALWAAVAAFAGGSGEAFLSAAGGFGLATPDLVTSIAGGPEFGLVATSSVTDGVTVFPPPRTKKASIDATPESVSLSDLHWAQQQIDGGYDLFGFSPRALYRRHFPHDFYVPPPPPVVVHVKAVRPPEPQEPEFKPGGGTITLKPGERRKVPYNLVLPPTPTPLDVYFMTDSTGSMKDAIASVQESVQDIVDDLSAARVNLHFGVADFRDWPQQADGTDTYPYRRRREVGPVDEELGDALASIGTGGGTVDGDDSALTAIYQAVTGEGAEGVGASIPAGEGAEFRDEALKVVLVASDDEMREPVVSSAAYPARPSSRSSTCSTSTA